MSGARPTNRPGLKGLGVLIFLLGLLVPAPSAAAHPADMYVQSQDLRLAREALYVDWTIIPGPILADAVWESAGPDLGGAISPDAAKIWIAPFLSDFSVLLDGRQLSTYDLVAVHWPAAVEALRTGEDSIKISLKFPWPTAPTGKHSLQIHNSHFEANSMNSFSLRTEGGLAFDKPVQKNGLLDLGLYTSEAASQQAPGGAALLTSWNSGTPNLPDFSGAVAQMAANLAQSPQTPSPQPSGPFASVTLALEGLVKTGQFSPLFLLGAFLLSLALGSLHALTPGHGKTLVAAYLVGTQGRTRDAVFLGTIVTATHTGSVLLLGFVTLFASHYVLPSLIAPWLEIASGVLIVGFGLGLLFQRRHSLAALLSRAGSASLHSPGDAATPDHSHQHSHTGRGTHEHLHPDATDGGDGAEHDEHAQGTPAPAVSLRSLFTLGVSGGLVPCPDAIAILLVAVALNRIPFGMLLIVSFSIGLALVLIGIGIAMVHGVRLIARSDALSRFAVYAPVMSALVVCGLGTALTVSAVNSLKFSQAVSQVPSAQTGPTGANARSAAAAPAFDLAHARLLYIAADADGWNQLFLQPLSGGKALQYTNEPSGITDYAMSADRKTIAYTLLTNNGGSAIWLLDADGSHRRLALDCPQSQCNFPQWYPDGQRLAYERLDQGLRSTVPRFSIWSLDLATGKTQPMFQDPAFASYAPAFSPDGQWLSYISTGDNTLMVFNLEDGRTQAVPLGFHSPVAEIWSPAGDTLLFGSEAERKEWAPTHMKAYSLSSGRLVDLGGSDNSTDYAGAWSPDGQWIAIDRSIPITQTQNSNQVWLVRPDGSQAHVLLHDNGASYSSLAWSPDSRYLTYSRYELDPSSPSPGRFDTYIADLRTGDSKLLVPDADLASFLP